MSLLPSQSQTFTATVSGTSNTGVTWSINPALASLASGATTAVYVAPSTAPTTQSGTITATSMADPSKTATAVITLLQAVTVSLSPSTVSLAPSGTQQFTATVLGTSNTAVTWSINPSVGTISSAGLYTAPSSILTSQTVTVTAQSVADPTKSASASVSLSRRCLRTGTLPTTWIPSTAPTPTQERWPEPWKTIAKVNSTTLTPGQSVGFKSGGVWRETLTPGQSGSEGHVITFGAYGSGRNPTFDGTDIVTGWMTYASYIYKASFSCVSCSGGNTPRQVFINGIRGTPVSSIGALTANGDWHYSAGDLYLYSTVNPSGNRIEATARDHDVLVSNRAYLTFTGLMASKAGNEGFEISTGDNITLINNNADLNGSDGIGIEQGSHSIIITGGVLSDNGFNTGGDNNGIGTGGMGAVSTPITITGVEIYGSGNYHIELYGPSGGTSVITVTNCYLHGINGTSSGGIQVSGPGTINATLSYNVIAGTSESGIKTVTATANVIAYNNTIYNNASTCLYMSAGSVSFKNNICSTNGTGRGQTEIERDAGSLTSDYNDIYHPAGGNFMYYQGSGGQQNFAAWKSNTSQDAHSMTTNPLFTSAGTGDFTLQAGSPALGASVYVAGVSAANTPNIGAK